MEKYFKFKKEIISNEFVSYLKTNNSAFENINFFGPDLLNRLEHFATNGKMIRGGLVLLAQEMFSEKYTPDGIKVAIAIELMHTSLLIHDDIMDNDYTRRGNRTIFAQYIDFAEEKKLSSPESFGINMGICVGDIGFFLAFSLFSQLTAPPETKSQLLSFFSKEMIAVGLMQMQDVYFASSNSAVSKEQILSMYKYKTARYTFTLPLVSGAILSGQPISNIALLEKLGESLGIIFQIRDDEIGLFQTEEEIGKPIGSDIREKKKTLFYTTLFQKVTEDEKNKLNDIFGSEVITPAMVRYVKELVISSGTYAVISEYITELSHSAKKIIDDLTINSEYKIILNELLIYNLKRSS